MASTRRGQQGAVVGGQVLRVLPRVNDDVNEEWLGDRS